ncbi:Predicted acetyltransferase [Psychrobacillus sp. OK028]|uniref:GNAT family N-acetyltransferase n=1 Tax=Psychrobacillus sp. OK028 TaxID=1884359 RepID=UPI0008919035|nr:GNAT family N-acetyltransferase [Psychrobacillus sp. OK028]SDN06592.1 Predicted acetyltransferase [Psychrobacillus sp. OK028]
MSLILREVLEEEKIILKNLFSLYLHDLSKYTAEIEIGEDGSFEYDGLDVFWETEGLSPFFIMLDKSIIGFILLVERPFLKNEYDFGLNDLFILNKYKGKGLGIQAVKKLFQDKKGKYFVIELVENSPAVSFWKKVYSKLTINFEERQDVVDGEQCLIQTFTIK